MLRMTAGLAREVRRPETYQRNNKGAVPPEPTNSE